MNTRTQVLVIVIAVLALLMIFQLIRKKKMELKYALLWIVLSACILLLGCFPQLIALLAEFFGVQTPINMLFFIGFCFSLLIIFSLSTALSRNSEKIKRLSQEIGILEKNYRDGKKDSGKKNENIKTKY